MPLEISRQPDDASCGPVCLQAVYRAYGDDVPLDTLLSEIEPLESGGTLAVSLACHALLRGYAATIYTYNLQLFDPTWFGPDIDIAERLERQAELKTDPKLRFATEAYRLFLRLGGRLRFDELDPTLVRRYLERGRPILTGVSATYLYGCARESGRATLRDDDIGGDPVGHFVVLSAYDAASGRVSVADPLHDNPRFGSPYYVVPIERVLGAILLGVLTYDANLLIVEPPVGAEPSR